MTPAAVSPPPRPTRGLQADRSDHYRRQSETQSVAGGQADRQNTTAATTDTPRADELAVVLECPCAGGHNTTVTSVSSSSAPVARSSESLPSSSHVSRSGRGGPAAAATGCVRVRGVAWQPVQRGRAASRPQSRQWRSEPSEQLARVRAGRRCRSTAIASATAASMLVDAVGLLEPPASAGVAGDGGVDVALRSGSSGWTSRRGRRRRRGARRRGSCALSDLREGDGGDAALLPLLRHLAGPPRVVHGLDDLRSCSASSAT